MLMYKTHSYTVQISLATFFGTKQKIDCCFRLLSDALYEHLNKNGPPNVITMIDHKSADMTVLEHFNFWNCLGLAISVK